MYSDIRPILEKLINIDTTISIDTLEAVDYIKSYLDSFDVKTHVVYNKEKTRASLLATIGDENNQGIIFSGHLDVVTANRDEWKTNPFELIEVGEKIYGRGTTDMKGAIACILSMVEYLKSTGKTYHFAFTHDEEGGFKAIEQLRQSNFDGFIKVKPYGCVVMEPTQLSPICAHKGAFIAEINIVGKASHSAFPELGIDALYYMVDIYNYIKNSFDEDKVNFEIDEKFSPNSSTLTLAMLNGGDATNKIPGNASLTISARGLANDDIKCFFEKVEAYVIKINNELKSLDKNASAEFIVKFDLPAFHTDLDSDFIKELYKKVESNEILKVSYATESGYFQKMGINTILFGPGNIAQAHTVNEYIEKKQLVKFCEYIKKIV